MLLCPQMKPDPQAFSDDDADQFADAFKPAWEAPDLEATHVSAPPSAVTEHKEEQAVVSSTLVMDRPSDWDVPGAAESAHAPAVSVAPVVAVAAAAPAVSIAEAPTETAPVPLNKRTVIGMAVPPAPLPMNAEVTPREVPRPASSSEAIEPEQIIESAPAKLPFSSATSSPNVASLAAGGAPKYTMGMGTQVMNNRPLPPGPAPAATIGSLPGSPGYMPSRPPQAPPVSADPFRTRAGSSSDFDAVKPRNSNKAIVIAVVGVMALIGLGVGLKAMISDDSADKPKSEPMVTGPAVTTAEIPPPPPLSEPTATSTATAAAKTAEPTSTTTTAAATAVPTPLAIPPQQHAAQAAPPPVMAPPRSDPPRTHTTAPPAPPPAAAKTPPKPANGGIVRDNPF